MVKSILHRKVSARQKSGPFTFIYALSDPRTGEVRYVGKTARRVDDRLQQHVMESRRKNPSRPVLSWIAKLVQEGVKPTISVLEIVQTSGDWQTTEAKWIAHYRGMIGKRCLNQTDGGDGAPGFKHSNESRAKLSAFCKAVGRKPIGNTGRKFGPEARLNMSLAHKGKPGGKRSQEAIEKARATRKARNEKWTPEQRLKTMEARRGYVASESHRKSLAEAGRKYWSGEGVVRRAAAKSTDQRQTELAL